MTAKHPALPDGEPHLPLCEPKEVGLSGERLARIEKHLRERYVEPGKIPGCTTLVARAGRVAYFDVQGQRDLERQRPLTPDTIFRIYSMSKPITSVALMSLWEEARFLLDDPVDKIIPSWKNLRVFEQGNHPHFLTRRPERAMTIRDLLTHTSGLTYGFMERSNVDAAYRKLGFGRTNERGEDLQTMIDHLAELPLEFSPGTRWNYSVSTDVCGYLVEQLSGMRLDDFLRERIFEPLGMSDTSFEIDEARLDRFAANYARTRRRTLHLEDDPQHSSYLNVSFLSGGGGLVSTAADYLRFCEMLRCGGELDGQRILGRRTIETMTRNHLPEGRDLTQMALGRFAETPFAGTGFGLGFSVILDPTLGVGVGSVGEYAWGGAASTIFWIDPREDLIVIFMTQLMPSTTFNFRGQLKQLVYSALE